MNFVTSISLVVLGAMFLALLGWGSIRAAWRNCEGRRGVFAALAILAAICSIVAQKPSPDTPTITVDALLRDVGCYATNNVFHAAVTNAQSYAGVDFSDCDLMVYARERASSDAASWFELTPRKKFSQQPADYAIENATNFNYMVYLNYVPPSPVHMPPQPNPDLLRRIQLSLKKMTASMPKLMSKKKKKRQFSLGRCRKMRK